MGWWLLICVVAYRFEWDPTRTEKEIRADIRELDVGDLDDMTEDVSSIFLQELEQRKAPPLDLTALQNSPDPGALAMGMQGKLQMTFAVLDHDLMAKEFPEGDAADKIASRWKGMMQNGGITAQAYPVGANRILFTVSGIGVFPELKKFVLEQPEIDYFEVDQSKFYPPGRTEALISDEERTAKEEKQGIADQGPNGQKIKRPPKPKPKKKKKKEEL